MLAVALLAVIAAVLVLTLGGGSSHPGRSPASRAAGGQNATQAAAAYLGLGASTLRRRLRNGETLEEIAESTPHHSAHGLVASVIAARSAELRAKGLTPAEIHASVARLRARMRAQLRRARHGSAVVHSAARSLGVSESDLRAELRSGKTLAQIAAAHGVSRTQLVEDYVRSRRAALDAARHAGQLTQAGEQRALRALRRRFARMLGAQNP